MPSTPEVIIVMIIIKIIAVSVKCEICFIIVAKYGLFWMECFMNLSSLFPNDQDIVPDVLIMTLPFVTQSFRELVLFLSKKSTS